MLHAKQNIKLSLLNNVGLLISIIFIMMSLTTLAHAQDKGADQKKSSWFKLCFKDKVATPPAKGKESKPEVKNICLTQYESFNPKNGRVLVAAAIRQIEGQKNKQFMVIVPHGMLLPAGVRVQVDKNKQFALPYTICTPGGCTAEIPATDDIMKQIQTGKEMRIAVLTRVQKPIFFPVPLNGFETAMNGKPIDNKKYAELLGKLWDKIRERNQKIAGQNGAEKKSN